MTVSSNTQFMESKKIKTSLIKKAKPISILMPTDQIDYRNVKTGFMPNLIHSLDASNIHILVKNINNINISNKSNKLKHLSNINLYTIHDCFAGDYKNMRLLELLVKHSFVELYFKQDYLEVIHSSFIYQISSHTTIHEKNNVRFINYTNNLDNSEVLDIPKLPEFK